MRNVILNNCLLEGTARERANKTLKCVEDGKSTHSSFAYLKSTIFNFISHKFVHTTTTMTMKERASNKIYIFMRPDKYTLLSSRQFLHALDRVHTSLCSRYVHMFNARISFDDEQKIAL